MREASDGELMRRCARGGPEGSPALEELLRRYGDAAYRLARTMLGSGHDAEEVAGEAFWRLYRSAERFDPARPLRPWLLRIVANLARSRLRASRPEAPLEELGQEPAAPAPEEEPPAEADPQALGRAVARLPEAYREALALRYGEDLPLAEVAAALGIGAGAARSRLHRARAALRREIRAGGQRGEG